MTTNSIAELGIPVVQSSLVPNDKVYMLSGKVMVHPLMYLRLRNPYSPIWCTRTLGNREMERDRRKYGKS